MLLDFITGENDRLSHPHPLLPHPSHPQPLCCAVLGDQGHSLELFACKTAPEHLGECDRNARHGDRDGDPEPGAWLTLHVPRARALWSEDIGLV